MAETDGPMRLLEVCRQRLSRLLHDAEHKHLAWLREVEEQGLRMLDRYGLSAADISILSNFGAEPELMAKTPSQRRRPRKRQSSCFKEDSKEPNRRRLSRRRSSIKLLSSKASSQQYLNKEPPQALRCREQEVSVPHGVLGSQSCAGADLLAQTGTRPAEAPVPAMEAGCQDCPQGADSSQAASEAVTQVPKGDTEPKLHNGSPVTAILTAKEEETHKRRASTSTPKAAKSKHPAVVPGDPSPQGLDKVLFQDSDSKMMPVRSKVRRSLVGGPHKSHRTSLAEKYSLAGKRESMIRRSISRAMSRRAAAARESSSASSRVSCQSSLEVFVEDVSNSVRPGLEPNSPSEKTPEDILVSSGSVQAAKSPPQHPPPPEQQEGAAGSVKQLKLGGEGRVAEGLLGRQVMPVPAGSCANPSSEPQTENQEQPHCAKAQENPTRIWDASEVISDLDRSVSIQSVDKLDESPPSRTRSYKQAMGALWNRPQPEGHTLSPLDDKQKSSANQTPPSSSPASKVVRPLKNLLQAVQRNQLLPSPGPTGRGGVIKSFIRRNTPSRPNVKERERQRLESLRKKQEAEEQRRNKVEEEKRRRQAEMKQKREERLRKALQARERVEQMEEEKKKRMEQKVLQSDEKVRLSHVREEVSEEQSKKKLSKKLEEAEARKQKVLRREEDEFEQQEPLQKRREDEVRGKGKKVLELRNLVEQQQQEHLKERDHKQRWREKALQLESAVLTEKNRKEGESPKLLHQLPGQEKRAKQIASVAVASSPWLRAVKKVHGLPEPQQLGEEKKNREPEALTASSGMWLSKTVKRSISTSCLGPAKEFRSPKVSENNYGMDLNSDDSTDDENEPRKPVPAWAQGSQLHQAILHQYYHPVDYDQVFGLIPSPKLEDIFGKSKPRYFKRTSSAVWHSPPETKSTCCPSCNFKN